MRSRTTTATPWAALALGALAACSGGAAPRGRAIVLISIDTLRPDRLGVYGNGPGVSPAIDALARDAVVFDSALSVAPWTLPAHMSMLTGLDPVAHGVVNPNDVLPDGVHTLAELFRAAGFDTAAFTDGGFAGQGWGLEQGFETFDAKHAKHGFERYLGDVEDWIEERDGAPFFLFLHSFDVHAPYDQCDAGLLAEMRARPTAPGPDDHHLFRGSFTCYARDLHVAQYGRIGELLNDYDAGVREADRGVERVLAALRKAGLYDEALIAVVSDHGESFYDHGLWAGHGLELTDDELRVPIVLKLPHGEGAGRRIGTLVDLLDLAPTLLDAADLQPDPLMEGSSLRALVRGGRRSRSWVFGGTYTTDSYFFARDSLKYITPIGLPPINVLRSHIEPNTPDVLLEAARGGALVRQLPNGEARTTYYANAADPLGLLLYLPVGERLYDRAADAGERHDLARERPDEAAALAQALQRRLEQSRSIAKGLAAGAGERALSEQDLGQLQQLGYAAAGERASIANSPELRAALEEALARPEVALPEADELDACDRAVHEVRLALRDRERSGAPAHLTPEERETLASCAERCTSWVERHPLAEQRFRMRWRVLEIRELARAGGAAFDERPHVRRAEAALSAASKDGAER